MELGFRPRQSCFRIHAVHPCNSHQIDTLNRLLDVGIWSSEEWSGLKIHICISEKKVCFCSSLCLFNITLIQGYAPTINAEEADQFNDDLEDLLELTPKKKDVLFITGDWDAKVRSQEIPGETGKFGLGVK